MLELLRQKRRAGLSGVPVHDRCRLELLSLSDILQQTRALARGDARDGPRAPLR
jgi:hypothetical protein